MVTTLAVGDIPLQIVVTYNASVYAASAQDIVHYALTLASSLLKATHNDTQTSGGVSMPWWWGGKRHDKVA